MKNFLTIVAFMAIFISANAQNVSDEQVKQEITTNLKAMGEAMQNGNPAGLASYFTEDTFFKLPGNEPATSRMAVQKIHEKMLQDGIGIKPVTEEVIVSGDFAVERGTVDMFNKEGKPVGKAQYLTLWKNTDEGWKIYRDVVSAMPSGE